jgi:hypothetical protein
MTRPRTCLRCCARPVRKLERIAVELRDFLKAMPHVARIEYPEPSTARGAPALLTLFWAAATDALGLEFSRGLAAELEGKCVYCAHIMELERRAAIPSLASTGASP